MRKIYKSVESDQEEPEGFIAHKGEQLGMNVERGRKRVKEKWMDERRMALVNERASEEDTADSV